MEKCIYMYHNGTFLRLFRTTAPKVFDCPVRNTECTFWGSSNAGWVLYRVKMIMTTGFAYQCCNFRAMAHQGRLPLLALAFS